MIKYEQRYLNVTFKIQTLCRIISSSGLIPVFYFAFILLFNRIEGKIQY